MTATAAPRWLSKAQVLYIHDVAIKRHGGSFGLRDEGLLESALARAENYYVYGEMDNRREVEQIL